MPDDDKDAEPYAPMRCMACGGDMVLINAIEDLTMAVIGFERHAYMLGWTAPLPQVAA